MADDHDEHSTPANRSWLERLGQIFHHEPDSIAELRSHLREMARRKIIDLDALEMLEGVLNVSNMQVRDVMIPRAQMVVVNHDQAPEEFLPVIVESAHSRFPVIGEDKDDVIGILLAKDLLKHVVQNPAQPIKLSSDLLRPAVFVPESKRIDTLLKEFKSSHNHLAIVVDEYGGIAGVITIEDVLEEIVGNIEDEYDLPEENFIEQLSDHHYSVNALTPIDEFNEAFNTHFSDEKMDTIGGYITQQFGYVPLAKERIELDDLCFTVTQANARRIISLKVELNEPQQPDLDT